MKALLIVDMQNDFMPGGALPVPRGDEIIATINQLIPHFLLVLATQDWHPKSHVSFAVNHRDKKIGEVIIAEGIEQILWPIHCVQHTHGADLVDPLNKKSIAKIFFKGTNPRVDDYSAFFDNAKMQQTGLGEYLKDSRVQQLYIAGVATDYCVLYSTLDAIDLGFTVYVVVDACRAINLQPEDEKKALEMMRKKGAYLITSENIANKLQ